MAITSGFFNSLNGDRVYDAEDFGALFDGVVTEGIFTTIYSGRFGCSYGGQSGGIDLVNVSAGKAWFNHTWITNDAAMSIDMPSRVTGYWTKIAISIVVNKQVDTRANSIDADIIGQAYGSLPNAQAAALPSGFLTPDTDIWRYPLAFVYLPPNGDGSTPTITDNRGTASCPYARAGEEVIDVAHGGTGATTPSQAIVNLGASPAGHNHDDWYYLKTDLDVLLAAKANANNVYTKSELDTKFSGKSDSSHTHDDRYYTEFEMNTYLGLKANAESVYTKTEVDERLADIQAGVVDPSKLPVIPITKGGTGKTTAAEARDALGITPSNIGAAPTSHEHSASAITSGTLGIARGGTGGTTAADARSALGAAAASHTHGAGDIASGTLGSDRLPTVPVSKGGTGATTAAAALTALGAAAASHNHAASAINSGTLSSDRLPTVPAGKGGSGQTSLQASLDAFIGSGRIKLTSGTHYGTSLPSSGNVAGRLFFLKV